MRDFKMIFILVLISIGTKYAPAQSPQQTDSKQLAESRELTSRVANLYREHKYDEALPLAKRALELGEEAVGHKDPRLIVLLINLGDLSEATVDFDRAKMCFERAVNIGETSFGQDDPRITRALDELGYLMSITGDYGKAADLLSRSLAIKEKSFGPLNVEVARAAYSLADVYRRSRELAKAESFYEKAISLFEQSGRKADDEFVELLRRYLIVLTTENKKTEAALLQSKIASLSAEPGVVEGGVVNGWAVKLVQPSYPAIALSVHASGEVAVQVLIDENGKVISARAITGHPLLQAAAIEAAKASRFTPTLKSGAAVKVRGMIIYNFVLR